MSSLEKIIDLIKKTGDNCVVLDQDGEVAYVVTTFDDYQNLILNKSEVAGLTENELVNKMNRDIATWKANQEAENLDNWQEIESAVEEIKGVTDDEKSLNEAKNTEEDGNSEEKYYFEPID